MVTKHLLFAYVFKQKLKGMFVCFFGKLISNDALRAFREFSFKFSPLISRKKKLFLAKFCNFYMIKKQVEFPH